MADDTGWILFLILIVVTFWIANDAKKRGKNWFLWGMGTFLFAILVVPLYLLVRPKGKIVFCEYCGKEKLETLPRCPHCKKAASESVDTTVPIKRACQNCGRITDDLVYSDGELLCENCRKVYIEEGEGEPNTETHIQKVIIDVPAHTLIVEIKNKFNKEPLPKAAVFLQNNTEKLERVSDIDGKVIFGKVKEGTYTLIVNSQGFEEESREITLNKNDRINIELKGKANLTIHVLDGVNHSAIADAKINLGDREVGTDEKGVAFIQDISFGKYDLIVTKDSYKLETTTQEIKEISQNIKIFLKPDVKLSEEYIILGERLRNSLNESMKKLSYACDMCIPEYYKGICNELIKLNETIASTPIYVYADQSSDKIDTLYKVTGQICKEMELILTNSENITEFINMANRGIKTNPRISINSSDYDATIQSYMNNPDEFLIIYKSRILKKLQDTDAEITKNLQNFNINPIANLWSISQKIITGAKNESEEAASLLLANILLDTTKKMLTSPEIIRVLKINPL